MHRRLQDHNHDHDHDDDDHHHHITFIHLYDMSEINFTKANVQVDWLSCDLPAGFQIVRIQDPES